MTIILPVDSLQAGCNAFTAGIAGATGTGSTVTEPAPDTQVVIVFLTVTVYMPGATFAKIGDAW